MDLHQPDEKGEVESRGKAVKAGMLPWDCKKRTSVMYVRDAETGKMSPEEQGIVFKNEIKHNSERRYKCINKFQVDGKCPNQKVKFLCQRKRCRETN